MSSLPPEQLISAAEKGAVWIQRKSAGKILRIRNLSEMIAPTDTIILNYDEKVLKLPELNKVLALEENKNYGVWIKPAGIMPQGTQAGDHTSLLRAVEKLKNKEIFLVHRLDRETEGLMLLAYNSQAAAKLSEIFQKGTIKKTYQAIVRGSLERGLTQTIDASLDGKEAVTHYEVLLSNEKMSLIKVEIETGRLHQIRRHLDFIGYPVMGDPKYGQGNKNRAGLQLLAYSLAFHDPWTGKEVSWQLDYQLKLS